MRASVAGFKDGDHIEESQEACEPWERGGVLMKGGGVTHWDPSPYKVFYPLNIFHLSHFLKTGLERWIGRKSACLQA